MAQLEREGAKPWQPNPVPAHAGDVVVQATNILREYLATDSRFSPEIAIERVRTVVNSKAGMTAFVNDALQPGHLDADAVVVKLAAALDQPGSHPEELVLRVIQIVESPLAVEVYDRERARPRS